jgi:tetratricopeptide (TPR) repeat protein
MPLVGAPPWSGAPQSMPLPRRDPFDARRFFMGGLPLWAGLVAFSLGVATVVYGVFALGKDWADSAWIAACVALGGAGVMVIAASLVLALRRFQWLTLGLSALLLVALSGAGGYALTNQSAIHRVQARALESTQQWPGAIREFALAGEQSPAAPNIARVELEWGEQYYSAQRYREATNLYLQALSDDSDATIETRAQNDLYQAYVAWLYASPPDDAYAEIGAFLEKYMQLSICDAECRSFTRPQAALALYKRGGALLKRGISYCDDAVLGYRDVVARYGDTQGGQLAAAALAKPVQFTAFVENLPDPQGLHVWLSRKVAPETHDYITYFSEDYAATLDSSGVATFPAVAPGLYNFSLLQRDGFHNYFRYTNPRFDPYTASVSPLCNASGVFDYS